MVRFSHGKINQRAKSGIFVDPAYWDNVLQCVMIPRKRLMTEDMVSLVSELRDTDALLRDLRKAIEDTYYTNTNTPTDNPNWLAEIIDRIVFGKEEQYKEVDFFGAWDLFIKSKKVSDKRRQMYNVVRTMLARFEAVKAKTTPQFKLSLDDLSPILLSEFETFLYSEEEYQKLYPDIYEDQKISKSRVGISRGTNTVSGRLDIFRTFYTWVNDKEITTNDPFRKFVIKPPVYGSPIYITKEERDTLYHTDMKSKCLNTVRDIFIFQSLIGCRVGDMLNFTKRNIIDGALEYIPSKTADKDSRTIVVPLNKLALEVLKRYNDSKDERLLPFISEQKYNKYIKECFKKAGLTRMVTARNARTGKYEQVPIYEKATSHMARRVFIGNLYAQVKDPNLIASLSGHSENSRSFSRYRDIDKKMKEEVMKLLE